MKKVILGLAELFADRLFRIVLCMGGLALCVKTFPSPAPNEIAFLVAIIISAAGSFATQAYLRRHYGKGT